MSALVTSSQGATGALQATPGRQPAPRAAGAAARRSHRDRRCQGRAQSLEAAQQAAAQDQGREQLRRFLTPGPAINPPPCRCSTDEHEQQLRRFPLIARIAARASCLSRHAQSSSVGDEEPDHRSPAARAGRSSCARARALPDRHAGADGRSFETAGGSGPRIAATSSVQAERQLASAATSSPNGNPRPSRQRIKAGCRRAIRPSEHPERSKRWAAPASSTSFSRSSPATSIPASGCSAARSLSRDHTGRDRHHAGGPVLVVGRATRTSSRGSSRRRCSSASSPISSATGTTSPASSSRALPALA